jgi:predicted membrane-bound spermidine synthase
VCGVTDHEGRGDRRLLRGTAYFFLCANTVGFLVLPGLAWFASHGVWPVAFGLVTVAAAMFGAVLPLVSHFAVGPTWLAGRGVSYLYVANIVGSVSGSFLTGFLLLDVWPLQKVALALVLLGCVVAAALLLVSQSNLRVVAAGGLAAAALAGGAVWATPVVFARFYERLLFGVSAAQLPPFSEVVEARSGIITVTPDGTVYGNGAYDGRITTSLADDRNLIVRAYALAGLHPAPRHVLMIGMGGGAWAQVVAHLPGVEKLTIVEINPGYLEMLARHPEVASLLRNPKVEIVIDDGRRWLNRHPDRRFDLIVSKHEPALARARDPSAVGGVFSISSSDISCRAASTTSTRRTRTRH